MRLCLCMCVYVCVCDMCLHASVHNIMCSAQPEVRSSCGTVLNQIQHIGKGGGRKWQLQVAFEAHNIHVGGKFLGHPPDIFWGILDPLILIILSSL